MVLIALPAYLECDHDGCSEVQNATVCLNIAGTLAFKPDNEHWQLGSGPGGVYVAFCPMHKRKLETPNAPRIVTAGGR